MNQSYIAVGLIVAQAILAFVTSQLPTLDPPVPSWVLLVIGAVSVGITAGANQVKALGRE